MSNNNLETILSDPLDEMKKALSDLESVPPDVDHALKYAKEIPGKILHAGEAALELGITQLSSELIKPLEEIQEFVGEAKSVADTVINAVTSDIETVCKTVATGGKSLFENIETNADALVGRLASVEGTALHDIGSAMDALGKLHLIDDAGQVITLVESELDVVDTTLLKTLFGNYASTTPDTDYGTKLTATITALQKELTSVTASPLFAGKGVTPPPITAELDLIEALLAKLPPQATALLSGICPVSELDTLRTALSTQFSSSPQLLTASKTDLKTAVKVLIAVSAGLRAFTVVLKALKTILPGSITIAAATSVSNTEAATLGVDLGVTGAGDLEITEGAGGSAGISLIKVMSAIVAPLCVVMEGVALSLDILRRGLIAEIKGVAA